MRIIIAEAGTEYKTAEARTIRSPEAAANEAREIAGSDTECMVVLCLNAKNGMLASEIISTGIVDASLVHPREVFRSAIMRNSSAIILVHNHPSGDTTPSAEDIRITRQVVDAGKIIGIGVLDHMIVGMRDGKLESTSIREMGLVDFS